MKRLFVSAIAFAALVAPGSLGLAYADGVCGVPLAQAEQVGSATPGSHRLNDAVALAFLNKFNNTGPVTRYQAPVWVIDRPDQNVLEFIATIDGRGCAFVAPGELRGVILKMMYGDAA